MVLKKTKRKKKQSPYPGLKEATQKTRQALQLAEKRYLIRTLQKHKGHIGKTAEAAKMSRTSLYRYLRKYKIRPNALRERPWHFTKMRFAIPSRRHK